MKIKIEADFVPEKPFLSSENFASILFATMLEFSTRQNMKSNGVSVQIKMCEFDSGLEADLHRESSYHFLSDDAALF